VEKVKWDETRQATTVRTGMQGGKLLPAVLDKDRSLRPHFLKERLARQKFKGAGRGEGKGKGKGKDAGRKGRCHVRRIKGGSESIMIQRRTLRFSKVTSGYLDDTLATVDIVLPLICPPVMLSSTTAESIAEGLKRFEPISLEQLAASNAKRKVEIIECDAAKANTSYFNRLRASKPTTLIMFLVYCMIHQLALSSGLLLGLVDTDKMELVNSLYSIALLLRTPGCFQVMLNLLDLVVRDFIVITDDPVDPAATATSWDILSILGWDTSDPLVVEIISILNDWWRKQWGLIHNCNCATRCAKDTLAARLTKVLTWLLLGARPDIPMPSRWTRVFQCLKWFGPFIAIHGLFQKVFRCGFDPGWAAERLGLAPEEVVEDEEVDLDAQPGLPNQQPAPEQPNEERPMDMEEARKQFQKEYSSRKGKGITFCRAPNTSLRVLLLTLILGPLHFGFAHLLKTAGLRSSMPDEPECPLPILDLLNPGTSFVVVILQYFPV
jgi:hypothetical protein